MATKLSMNFSLPPASTAWVTPQGMPTQAFAQYMAMLDSLIRQIVSAVNSLQTAANDNTTSQ